MKINLKEFYRFTQQQHKITQYAQRMREGRKKPQVGAGVIFLVMIYMLAWGQRHFLQMDQMAPEKAVKRFFQFRRRMVCSDSTIARSLAGFDVTSVRPCVGPHLRTTADSTDAGPGGTAAAPPSGHRCNIAGPL